MSAQRLAPAKKPRPSLVGLRLVSQAWGQKLSLGGQRTAPPNNVTRCSWHNRKHSRATSSAPSKPPYPSTLPPSTSTATTTTADNGPARCGLRRGPFFSLLNWPGTQDTTTTAGHLRTEGSRRPIRHRDTSASKPGVGYVHPFSTFDCNSTPGALPPDVRSVCRFGDCWLSTTVPLLTQAPR